MERVTEQTMSEKAQVALLQEGEHPSHTAPIYIPFDPKARKQVEEVKALYMKMKREGRQVVNKLGARIDRFQDVIDNEALEVLASNQDDLNAVGLRILDETGDRRIVWQANDPDQVKEAAALYNEYIAKGWKAYAVHRRDSKLRGLRIVGFSEDLEEIIFDDSMTADKMKGFANGFREAGKTIRQRLDQFAEVFSEVKMLPKTYPG